MRLLWTAIAQNRKTGPIPTAYVGETRAETEASCSGCALRSSTCYAWRGPQLSFGLLKIQARAEARPGIYTLTAALARRSPAARVARVAAVGDPSRADRRELLVSLRAIRGEGLGVVGYTHFWGDRKSASLRTQLMASCDDIEQAEVAVERGWRAAVLLPADHEGAVFFTPGGWKGVVCPAQRLDGVTCNTCGMCDPQHRVWKAGKVQAIGFVDHSRAASTAARRSGRRLATAGVAGASAPVGW